ncbi:uncharacterized protein HD556DRAFT_1310900 [Suillus plorans]|uniref:Uncharacterized protein n=1 Tax=Suillus plorans TaxID=116603 RepID=A0A9P7AIE6_9AGAM|nr:uncharacterized protein HD556DRAFT_1310900 [Suillus plorans]KAG1790117.1 hypothetical protein HD556DRAFT_1310900 [Suillus plorans]
MESSNYSTKSPIVLAVEGRRDSDLTNDILNRRCSLKKINDTLNVCFDKESIQLPVPDQCSDALHLIIHHLHTYQKVTHTLMQHSVTVQSLAVYIAVTHYYWDVLLAFCKEIEDDAPGSNKTWRSAHLDYHFAMALENNAFSKEMQKAALSKIKRTWTDFKRKKAYRPVMQLDVQKYHQQLCNGKNMCGDATADHKMSVEDMIAEIVEASATSMPLEVDAEKCEKIVRFDDVAAEPKKSTKRTTVRKVKMTVRPIDSATASSTAREVQEDDIDETAHMFEMKEDGRKSRKSVKGGRLQKEARGSTLRDSTPEMSRANRATRNLRTQGKRNASADVESEEEMGDDDKNVNKVTRLSIHDTGGRRVVQEHVSSSAEESEPTRATRAAKGKGKRRAIVESDDEDEISNDAARGMLDIFDSNGGTQPIIGVPESTPMPVREPTLLESKTTTQMDTESSPKKSNQSVVAVDEVGNKDDTSDDLIGYPDENLPSTLDDWEDWHTTAFRKGNSHMFMKLGTWILLRFRQLAKVPMEEDPDGLLIPDHPANYQMDFDADFHEALGMTRLYSAVAHIDTHPEYLAHIFHEIGKASSEERLGNSHPGFRPLPELPVPVKSMVSIKHWPYSSIEELDAEGDRDDEDVSGALGDMLISGAPVSAPVVTADEHDPLKRKRTMSSTLSPPKADGGRGSSKRPKNTSGTIFMRHSSPTTTFSQLRPVDTIEAASSSIPSDSRVTRDCGMDTTADPVVLPHLTQAIQHHDSIGDRSDIDSNMHISSPSNSQDAEEHIADPGNDASLARIDFMHDSSVDQLLDPSQQSTVVDDIMEDSDIMEGSDDIEGSNTVEGNDKNEVILRTKASWDRLSRAKDEDVRVLVKSTPE